MTCPFCGLTDHPVAECPERLEDKFGLPSDYEDGTDVRKKPLEDDEEVRTDGSGSQVEINANALRTKWPIVRDALIECNRGRISAGQLADGRDVSPSCVHNWLETLVDRGDTERVRTQIHAGERRPALYRVPADANELPEVLLHE